MSVAGRGLRVRDESATERSSVIITRHRAPPLIVVARLLQPDRLRWSARRASSAFVLVSAGQRARRAGAVQQVDHGCRRCSRETRARAVKVALSKICGRASVNTPPPLPLPIKCLLRCRARPSSSWPFAPCPSACHEVASLPCTVFRAYSAA